MTAAPESEGLPPGEMLAIGAELLLVDRMRADAIATYSFKESGEQLLVMLTFEGRLNGSTDRQQYTVALHPEQAPDLATRALSAQIVCERRANRHGGDRR